MFNFQNVISVLLVCSITALWAHTISRDSIRSEYFKEEFNKIKTDQQDLADKVGSLNDDYESVQSMLRYNEAGITITLEQLKETSSLLSDLSTIDAMLIKQLKDVRYGQGEAELLLEEVKKIALTKPVPQIIKNVVEPEKQITPVIESIPAVIVIETPIETLGEVPGEVLVEDVVSHEDADLNVSGVVSDVSVGGGMESRYSTSSVALGDELLGIDLLQGDPMMTMLEEDDDLLDADLDELMMS